MALVSSVTGLQHLGIPTEDMEKTIEFYKKLGFEIMERAPKGSFDLCFMKYKDLVIEFIPREKTARIPGAVDHYCFNVTDINKAYEEVKAAGFEAIEGGIKTLNFVFKGISFFTILGPNDEKIEFNQFL